MKFEQTRYDLGAERYLATGEVLPDSVLGEIREHDAILLGAVGGKPNDPNLPPGILERGPAAQAALRARPLRQPAPVADLPRRRVTRWPTPGEVDFVVVREGTEGPYTGNGGALRVGTPDEIATEVVGQHRLRRRARRPRRLRPGPAAPRKKLTLVHKTNVLVNAGAVWWRLFQEVAAEFPDVTVDYMHIDAATIFMTTDPARFDVIVTDNLFGDIITDLAAAITGGIGLAASAATSTPTGPRPPCSSRSTARRPTSPASRRPTPPPRSSPRRCCSTTSGYADAAAGGRGRGRSPTWPPRTPGTTRRTSEVGDAIAARVAG